MSVTSTLMSRPRWRAINVIYDRQVRGLSLTIRDVLRCSGIEPEVLPWLVDIGFAACADPDDEPIGIDRVMAGTAHRRAGRAMTIDNVTVGLTPAGAGWRHNDMHQTSLLAIHRARRDMPLRGLLRRGTVVPDALAGLWDGGYITVTDLDTGYEVSGPSSSWTTTALPETWAATVTPSGLFTLAII